jgi:hypothetical protein
MRASLLLAVLALSGCVPSRAAGAAPATPVDPNRPFIELVHVDGGWYVIDPFTETCFVGRHDVALGQVPCEKVKRRVPEAARFITWVPDAPAPTP